MHFICLRNPVKTFLFVQTPLSVFLGNVCFLSCGKGICPGSCMYFVSRTLTQQRELDLAKAGC